MMGRNSRRNILRALLPNNCLYKGMYEFCTGGGGGGGESWKASLSFALFATSVLRGWIVNMVFNKKKY